MGFLICQQTKKPKDCDGAVYIPTMNNLEILTQYFYDSNNEMGGVENITMEDARNKVIENINPYANSAYKDCSIIHIPESVIYNDLTFIVTEIDKSTFWQYLTF